MANDINSVYIQVIADTGEVQRNLTKAEKAFLGLNKTTKKTGGLSKSIARDMTKMAAGIFAVDRAMSAAASAARRMVQDVSDFQRMSVELKVATGSAIQAEAAFSMLQETAKKLPTSLKDLTTGFVRLKNMGLDASESSLISFSNTAAAMGKSLKQFVEAVADANTREFERLKEFGILARNEGDKIRFVFRGVTTEVNNSSKDIVKFLTDIGQTEFAGAATEQIDTLESRFTKLSDAIFNLNIAFGEGAAGALGDLLLYLTEKATSAAANKGLSDLQDKLKKTQRDADGGNFLGMFGRTTEEVALRGNELRTVFKNLTAKEFPAAIQLLREQKEKVMRLEEAGGAVYRGERRRLANMHRGFKVAEARLKQQRVYAKEVEKENAAIAHGDRIEQQRAINKAAADEFAFNQALEQAKAEGDVAELKRLQAEVAKQQVPIQKNLALSNEDQAFSASELKGFNRDNYRLEALRKSIGREIVKIAEDETAARQEQLDIRQAEANLRADENRKQFQALMALGDIQKYNADREKERALASKIATSEGVSLSEALEEKYKDINAAIDEQRQKLKAGGLLAEEIVGANDALDALQQELDATKKALDGITDDSGDAAKEMQQLFDDVREGIADAVVEGENLRGVLVSVLKQIAKTNLLSAIGGFGQGGEAGSGLLGLASGFFKAKGGPVTANRSYIVGERGPELFTPSGSGSITPNNRMGGGRSGEVNVTNNFSISGGVDQQTQQMIAQSVSTSVQLAVAKVEDNKRRRIS